MLKAATDFSRLLAHVETHAKPELTALITAAGELTPQSFEKVCEAVVLRKSDARWPEPEVQVEAELVLHEPLYKRVMETVGRFGIEDGDGSPGRASLAALIEELLRLAPDTLLVAAAKAATRRALGCVECRDLVDEIGLTIHPDLASNIHVGSERLHRQAALAV